MNDAREQAERSADRIRAELLATLRELNRRRHRAFDLRYQLGKHFFLLAAIAGGAHVVMAQVQQGHRSLPKRPANSR